MALLPAGATPWVAATVVLATAALLVWGLARFAGVSLTRTVHAAAPLALLSLWVVPLLPVLADRWPMLLLLARASPMGGGNCRAGLVLWRIEPECACHRAGVARVGPAAVVVLG
jgi:hypothetical protein